MSNSIFSHIQGLDTEYLEEAYGNDTETAVVIFEQYLSDLPQNLEVLKESIRKGDVQQFQHHIHKQKPGYSYVGLTDVTQKIQELQVKCLAPRDMETYKPEIDAMIARIESSRGIISKSLERLQS